MTETQTLAQLFDLDSGLTDDEREIRSAVRTFGDKRLRPHIARWYEEGSLPARDLAKELGDLGVLGMHLDGYGCAGMSAFQYGLACLELEAVDSGVRSLVSVQGSLAMYAIHRWGSEDQKTEWLPRMAAGDAIGCFGLTEPDYGSDPAGMRTRAERDGDDWILNGTKMWITNAPIADVAVVWARVDEAGTTEYRGFVVPTDTPGFSAPVIDNKLSLRASVTGEIVLDDVRLPGSAVLPEVRTLRGPLSCLNEARFGIVFGAVGAARDCLETAIEYAQTRRVFDRSLATFQLTQAKIADMALEVGKAHLLAYQLGRIKDRGEIRPEQISTGKLNSTREAIAIARQARTILAANGITGEYPVLRHANNLESVLTYEGTAEIHQLTIGRALTGASAFR